MLGLFNLAFVFGVAFLIVFLPPLYPGGVYPSLRWSGHAKLAALGFVTLYMGVLLSPGPIPDYPGQTNPFGVTRLEVVAEVLFFLGIVALAVAILVGLAAMVVRFRRSRGVERLQMKWFVSAIALALAYALFGETAGGLLGVGDSDVVVLLLLGLIPASVGVAILRHRLYDIDRILNRTLVYGLLSAVLGISYVGLVLMLQGLFQPISGSSDIAIAITTLVVAAAFLPARQQIQVLVDRRFNRRAYDAERTLGAFTRRLREGMDLDDLQRELLSVVGRTMEPSLIGLWLREVPTAFRAGRLPP